jgi:dienelactone hydrolase
LAEPLFLSCAEIDHTFPNEYRNRAVEIMQAEKKIFQVQLFQGVEHGFALRGSVVVHENYAKTMLTASSDLNNAYERYTKEQSLKGLADWCNFWLPQ